MSIQTTPTIPQFISEFNTINAAYSQSFSESLLGSQPADGSQGQSDIVAILQVFLPGPIAGEIALAVETAESHFQMLRSNVLGCVPSVIAMVAALRADISTLRVGFDVFESIVTWNMGKMVEGFSWRRRVGKRRKRRWYQGSARAKLS